MGCDPDGAVGYRHEAWTLGLARGADNRRGSACSLPLSLATTEELAVAEDKLDVVTAL
jgi:hypothetical protein